VLEATAPRRVLSKAEYKRRLAPLENRISLLQNRLRDGDRSAVIVLEGPDESGKTTVSQRLTETCDPRGFRVWHTYAPDAMELRRPWLWRFWLKTPRRGSLACFDRSWYGRVLVERVEDLIPDKEVEKSYREITWFEKTLAANGTAIVKLLLNLSKREQRRRFDAFEDDPNQKWRIRSEDWHAHRRFGRYRRAFQDMIRKTSHPKAPWTIIPADDHRTTEVLALEAIARSLAKVLK
jgi:polyphosphate kinase 2 (PPK2 family)